MVRKKSFLRRRFHPRWLLIELATTAVLAGIAALVYWLMGG